MLDILVALIPAVMWGFLPIVSSKLGGKAQNQVLGTTFGALIFSIIAFFVVHPNTSFHILLIGFISGLFWSLGQMNQFIAFKSLGVSKTMPMSTGMQLVGTTLFGVFLFHEWSTTTKLILGITAIILIIVGVFLTSFGEKDEDNAQNNLIKGITTLIISTIGYVVYIVILRYFNIGGWEAILPQSMGMVIGALLLTIRHNQFNKYTLRNVLTGIMWGIGNLGLLIATPRVGVATSFSLSQMGIIFSTLGGIFLLGEKKTTRQIIFVCIGCLLVVAGGVFIGYARSQG
ncbi:GRP family sugar transporter [Terrilactibacillus laevilacticus]|uniref:GRP family sugar transporter n=1 Tax=Terrilactibacillus laevilacticus TaxID=1380157 RepID=A0ABW5PUM7_9BACI|nr:GRP family sugar transporter [Terrilactibacillus laevilacticus]